MILKNDILTSTEIVRLLLPPGKYQVIGKVHLQNRDPQAPFTVHCNLVPSTQDGTPQSAGVLGADFGEVRMARAGDPGDRLPTSLFIRQELSALGFVSLTCHGDGNAFGAFAAYSAIRAIAVGSITTTRVAP
jgi:hypothetical protein